MTVGSMDLPPPFRSSLPAEGARWLEAAAQLADPAMPCARLVARAARIPRRDWAGIRPPLAELFACAANAGVRERQIASAKEDWGFTRQEIAEFLGVHVETVTRTVRKARRRLAAPRPEVCPPSTTNRWNLGPDPK
ncbi:MAG: hypothetical protein ACM3H9_03470 [Rhodospirillaceae bacterium]